MSVHSSQTSLDCFRVNVSNAESRDAVVLVRTSSDRQTALEAWPYVPAIFRQDSAQRRHSFAQSVTTLSSANRSQLTAHASHTSVQISHTRRCAGESRSMKLTQVAQK